MDDVRAEVATAIASVTRALTSLRAHQALMGPRQVAKASCGKWEPPFRMRQKNLNGEQIPKSRSRSR
jgi:hypothetical protein